MSTEVTKTRRVHHRAESRWPPSIAVLVFIVLNTGVRLYLPSERLVTLPFLTPVIELVLLGVLVLSDPLGVEPRAQWFRKVAIALVLLLVAAALWGTIILVAHIIDNDPQTNSAGYLLAYGALVLVGNNIAFALLFWQFDSGGPIARSEHRAKYPDFAFVEQVNPDLAEPGWFPIFADYMYLGFTNTVAFSPTDVMPLATWAKMTMALQSTVSIVVLGLVIARAVNVLQ
ncbi:MAG TPA: hypothetical protein VK461_15885 [Acidimicrobiales bacterium]|nr:hypothetical protein [Acidimicrobiales bacterium]